MTRAAEAAKDHPCLEYNDMKILYVDMYNVL